MISIQIKKSNSIFNLFSATWAKTCLLSDPDFNKCNFETILGIFENTLNGNYKINGLESTNPMVLEKITVLQGDGPVAVNASLSKLKIYGLPQVQLLKHRFNPDDLSWTQLIKIPKMRLEANYRMMGQILVIPLNVRT